jgi:hypothetical protein
MIDEGLRTAPMIRYFAGLGKLQTLRFDFTE